MVNPTEIHLSAAFSWAAKVQNLKSETEMLRKASLTASSSSTLHSPGQEKLSFSQVDTLPKLTARTWKWMVGILVSSWDGLFSGGELLVSGSVRLFEMISLVHDSWCNRKIHLCIVQNQQKWDELISTLPMSPFLVEDSQNKHHLLGSVLA